MKFWTKDEIQTLKNLWSAGKTAAEIAKEIGRPRNGIIGQAHRLGLEKRENPVKRRNVIEIPKRTRQTASVNNGLNFKKHHMTIKKENRLAETAGINQTIYGQGKRLEDIGHNECRWPIGDKDYIFCAAPIHKGCYCENHHKIAYKKQVVGEEV